jgi:hypothetical protein
MTPKPDSRRIDWTLSATPTRRGVRVFVIFILIPGALIGGLLLSLWLVLTIARGPRAPQRSFTAIEFLPPITVYPVDYEVLEAPRPAGIDSPLRMFDYDDAYAMYKPASESSGRVQIIIHHQSYWNSARGEYQYWLAFLSGYEPVSQIDFQSDRAQAWVLVCQDVAAEESLLWCAYVARYDEFVVDLRAGVSPNHLSFTEFENLLRAIDQRAIELLGAEPAPTP